MEVPSVCNAGVVPNKTANEWNLINQKILPSAIPMVPNIFNYTVSDSMSATVKKILEIQQTLCCQMTNIIFSDPVAYVYNPLVYAFKTHLDYLQKYCNSNDKYVLFLGMNPGPFGMAQNGVPFGETSVVRDWLGIQGNVYKPLHEHPKRPVCGLACGRAEISGKRFWGLFQELCGQPKNFFSHCFVYNFCPMSFMDSRGKNITLPQLPLETRQMLNEVCDAALKDIISVLNVKIIICLGRYVEERAKNVLLKYEEELRGVRVEYMSHPSPLNIKANTMGWENLALGQLKKFEVLQYLQ